MVDILESKVVGTNKETWYKLVGTSEDTKPIGEFPAGTGHTVANGSRFYEVDTEIGYELKEEGWIAVGQNVRLPDVTAEDNGKVLSVVEGNWDKAQPTNELPDVTEEDNGDVLSVVEGVWAKTAPPSSGGDTVIFELEHPSGNTFKLKNGTFQSIYDAIIDKKIPVLIFPYTDAPGATFSDYRIFYFTGVMTDIGSRLNFEQIITVGSQAEGITALRIIRLSFLRSELSSNMFTFSSKDISI